MSLAPAIGKAGGFAFSLLNWSALGCRNFFIAATMAVSYFPPTPGPFIFGGSFTVGAAPPTPGTIVMPGWRMRLTSDWVAVEIGAVPANRSRRNVPATADFFMAAIAAIVLGRSL